MKHSIVLLCMAALLTFCGTPRSTHPASGSPTKRAMRTPASTSSSMEASEPITVSGTEYVTIEGRSEFGVRPDLEGTWVLVPAESKLSNTNNITAGRSIATETGKTYNGNVLNEKMKNSKEVMRDTTITIKGDGVHTATTVYLMNNEDGQGNKITPPQSSNPNMHIPEPPSLRFYGSNETFSGFTGCNRMSGRYTMSGRNAINFSDAAASTKMVCIGDYDEQSFLDLLHKVNAFKSSNGQLQLMDGETVLLTFKRKN